MRVFNHYSEVWYELRIKGDKYQMRELTTIFWFDLDMDASSKKDLALAMAEYDLLH